MKRLWESTGILNFEQFRHPRCTLSVGGVRLKNSSAKVMKLGLPKSGGFVAGLNLCYQLKIIIDLYLQT